jgi:hypothetical protein
VVLTGLVCRENWRAPANAVRTLMFDNTLENYRVASKLEASSSTELHGVSYHLPYFLTILALKKNIKIFNPYNWYNGIYSMMTMVIMMMTMMMMMKKMMMMMMMIEMYLQLNSVKTGR